jgi:bifunctional UDP-N-acetylglucosamine pyrophosphorylase/glucosamine-1-phosphate N-acetyltransferase/UDP-N-acetylglucosamine pyrophosphorylase
MAQKTAIVMAAGKGTRMESDLPKVLVNVCGRPMVDYVLDAIEESGVSRTIVVVGYKADDVQSVLSDRGGVEFALQEEQLGTGHAVMCCRDLLLDHQSADSDGAVLVVAGDSPMMESSSLAALLAEYEKSPAACIIGTTHKENPTGLGRIIRDSDGKFIGIVEERDATEQQKRITEVNMSYYVFRCGDLLAALGQLKTDNAQGEYYITDCPGVFLEQGKEVRALPVLKPNEAMGINNLAELAVVEAAMGEGLEAET